jgi:hypothetical protein
MARMWLVWVLIAVVILMVAIWWFWGIAKQQPTPASSNTQVGADFQPLVDSFNSYPEATWFGTPEELECTLYSSPYRYRILLSSGRLYYDSRDGDCKGCGYSPGGKNEAPLSSSVEYAQASAVGDSALVRDGQKMVAIRVVSPEDTSNVRIIHISAPAL